MTRPHDAYERSALWHALATSLDELQVTGEIALATAPEYVLGYLCQELAARGIITEYGLAPRTGREPAPDDAPVAPDAGGA